MTETRRSYCGLCHPRCGLLLEMENGKAVKVKGDQDHPITRGRICNRGKLMLDHGWWFPERQEAEPELFGAFESNANILRPDGPEFCSPEIGGWPHTALMCRVEKL